MTNRLHDLADLAVKWKVVKFPCAWSPLAHNYLEVYQELLAGRDIRKIVEVGIGPAHLFHPEQVAGCSLRMWAEVFPEAQVIGLDYDPKTMIHEERIRSILCDQSDELELRLASHAIGGGIDLFIDDGSHRPADQALTAEVFLPLLSDHGVYVIEDVLPRQYYGTWCPELLPQPHRVVELDVANIMDDRLVILERRDLVQPVAQ
jgi:hypothetical protein